jgi:hypothetical protein
MLHPLQSINRNLLALGNIILLNMERRQPFCGNNKKNSVNPGLKFLNLCDLCLPRRIFSASHAAFSGVSFWRDESRATGHEQV